MGTTDRQEKTRGAINSYCAEKGISKAAFAVRCGVSEAVLSFIENGQFEKVSASMLTKIDTFIKSATTNAADLIYQSADFLSAFDACDKARKYRLMVGITADTGMGKTTALRTYARQKNTYYISFDKTMRATQFFACLLRELGSNYRGSLYEMINRIADILDRKDNPLLIIDECGKLTHNMILYLQILRDKTAGNCGVVLSGMPYFRETLKKNADREKEGYAEFLRRVNVWHSFAGLSASEVAAVCVMNGIEDKDKARAWRRCKRFGDLVNEIYLYKIINNLL